MFIYQRTQSVQVSSSPTDLSSLHHGKKTRVMFFRAKAVKSSFSSSILLWPCMSCLYGYLWRLLRVDFDLLDSNLYMPSLHKLFAFFSSFSTLPLVYSFVASSSFKFSKITEYIYIYIKLKNLALFLFLILCHDITLRILVLRQEIDRSWDNHENVCVWIDSTYQIQMQRVKKTNHRVKLHIGSLLIQSPGLLPPSFFISSYTHRLASACIFPLTLSL